MKRSIFEKLSGHPIFAMVPTKNLERIAAASRLRRFKAGDFLWHADEHTDSFGLIVEGLLESSVHFHRGECTVAELLKPGDVCGFRAYLRGGRSLSSLRAVVDSAVILVPVSLVLRPHWDKASFFEALARSLENRYERQLELRAIGQESPQSKIPAVLLWIQRTTGSTIPLTQAVIAKLVGLTEATVCRALAPLKKEGVVSVSRGVITIRQPDELARVLRTS